MDHSDKTVFKQPRPGGDRTVVKPSPGGKGAPRRAPESPPAESHLQPAYQGSASPAEPLLPARSLNPLVSAADTLIVVYGKVRQAPRHGDVAGLYQQLSNEMRNFEVRARDNGIKPEIILAARYVLCSALDEAVLNTPWGSDSPWAQRTLLSAFHNETSGGEKFFLILDRMRQAPGENLLMLELMYICLSLGFEGRYRLANRGRDALEQIKDDLFRLIRQYRGEHERSLSPSWHGLGKTRASLSEYVPLWVLACVVAGVLLLTYSGFRYWLYTSSTPVVENLEAVTRSIEEPRDP
jgi:type VI secretion system protein ImpK